MPQRLAVNVRRPLCSLLEPTMHNIQEAIDVASLSHLGRAESIELRTGRDAVTFRRAILSKLTYFVGKAPEQASQHDWFVATALATRDCIVERWLQADRAM